MKSLIHLRKFSSSRTSSLSELAPFAELAPAAEELTLAASFADEAALVELLAIPAPLLLGPLPA